MWFYDKIKCQIAYIYRFKNPSLIEEPTGDYMQLLNRISKIIFILVLALFVVFYFKTRMNDRVPPVISMESDELEISVDASKKDLLKDVSATDNKDGELTDSVILENLSNFTEKGQRVATYAVFDSSGNLARATRIIKYKDYVSPRFEISAPLVLPTSAINGTSSSDYLSNVSATDCLDGDVSHNVKVLKVGEVQEEHYGTIADAELQVFNSAGDVSRLTFPVVFQTSSTPQITLKEYVVYLKKGDTFDPESYITGAMAGQEEMDREEFESTYHTTISYNSKVDINTAGVYTVNYVAAYDGRDPSMTYMVVVVE